MEEWTDEQRERVRLQDCKLRQVPGPARQLAEQGIFTVSVFSAPSSQLFQMKDLSRFLSRETFAICGGSLSLFPDPAWPYEVTGSALSGPSLLCGSALLTPTELAALKIALQERYNR